MKHETFRTLAMVMMKLRSIRSTLEDGLPNDLPFRGAAWRRWVTALTFRQACMILMFPVLLSFCGCGHGGGSAVVIYTSQDQVYSQAILRDIETASGLAILPVFDSEAVKTVGLANRLIAEKRNPQCDVWWSNEEMRTRQLQDRGILASGEAPRPLGYRTRRLVINTNLLSAAEAPRRFQDLTNSVWKGRFALAYPQFGTTATHFHALRQRWGESAWKAWCRALVANEPMLVDGNSSVVRLVGAGEVVVGMTDWDDIAAGQRSGLPLQGLPLADDALIVFSTAALVDGAPHRESAQELLDWLAKPETLQRLVGGALEGLGTPKGLEPIDDATWRVILKDLETTSGQLSELFLR